MSDVEWRLKGWWLCDDNGKFQISFKFIKTTKGLKSLLSSGYNWNKSETKLLCFSFISDVTTALGHKTNKHHMYTLFTK